MKQTFADETDKAPRAGKGLLSRMLWVALVFIVFWWLSSGSGEATALREVVSALFGWRMSVVFGLLGAAVAIMLGITVVGMSAQVMTVPVIKPLTDPAAWTSTPPPRDALEREVQALGFSFIGDFDAVMSATTTMWLRAYIAPDRLRGAVFMDGKSGSERVTILELSTKLSPSGSVVVNTSPYPRISSYPLDKCVCRAPWKKTAAGVLELHELLCRAAGDEKFTAQPLSFASFAEEVISATRDDMEYQVKTGRYRKVGDDQYRQTLRGVAIAVPLLWLKMTYSFLFCWYRPPAAFFCWRVRRRLRRLRLQTDETNDERPESDEPGDEASKPPEKPISAGERRAPVVKM